MRFKTVRLTAIRNGSKRTIFACGRLGLLQMVSEPVTGWCGSDTFVGPLRRVDCEIPHWLERRTKHSLNKGVETSP